MAVTSTRRKKVTPKKSSASKGRRQGLQGSRFHRGAGQDAFSRGNMFGAGGGANPWERAPAFGTEFSGQGQGLGRINALMTPGATHSEMLSGQAFMPSTHWSTQATMHQPWMDQMGIGGQPPRGHAGGSNDVVENWGYAPGTRWAGLTESRQNMLVEKFGGDVNAARDFVNTGNTGLPKALDKGGYK